jgi:hypothetical protein
MKAVKTDEGIAIEERKCYSDLGQAVMVADWSGKIKENLVVEVRDYIIEVEFWRGLYKVKVWQVLDLEQMEDSYHVKTKPISFFDWQEWQPLLPEFLREAVDIAEAKASNLPMCQCPICSIKRCN